MPLPTDIPRPTVKRLSLYLRTLDLAVADGRTTISSSTIARTFDFTDAQVRRDLACLGQAGRPGVGYSPASLATRIRAALSLDRAWNIAIVGTGKIGTALMGYPRFAGGGFKVLAAFDTNQERIGTTIFDVVIHPLSQLHEVILEAGIELAVLAVPADVAQSVAERLVEAGVKGILNFAPVQLQVNVPVQPIDLSRVLEQLAFEVSSTSPS
ncbi:MAG: redox-sensing transcriptional repressor Rex [Phycisphaerales bacterium]|nr:redox-sensing transcriptional repressor Rex [Phycisphaerales bacterium]